ncbi:PTS galactitol transporter subunit IIC [Clostridium neuense]|uniref:PTS galactitol transporter subunit IIC n=1 Tax=Clostridium neuense TaxID=1728934 RepID=A0ABW8T8Q4_9CLOT
MLEVLKWFISLGSTVFLPVIICIFGLVLGVKLSKAIMAGITVGIGFIGLNLVIGLLSSSLGVAIQLMGKKYGFSLSVMDIGCGVGGPLAFSTTMGILIIPISIILNFVFVMLGWTKTLNVDIWNFWFPAFIALTINALTGKFWMGIAAMVVSLMLQWLLADLFQEKISKFFNYPGIAITHMMALSGVVFAIPINWLFDRIPGLNKIDADTDTIQKKFGIFGDTVVIGLVIGIAIGALAGYDFAKITQLGMETAAIMKLMPKMVAMFMEGLLPICESAKEFTDKKLNGRKVNIGMDAALTVGHPAVMSATLLMVPISLLLAIILPGNQVLPFGDLAFYAFAICLMIPFFRGNIIRTIIGCAMYMCTMLYLSTWLAPLITKVFKLAHYNVGTSGTVSSVNCGLWPVALFVTMVDKLGVIGICLIGIAVLSLLIYTNKIRVKAN